MTDNQTELREPEWERDWFCTPEVRETFFSPSQQAAASIYPKWAPTEAVSHLINGTGISTTEDGEALLVKLCTKPEMERVWRRLHKQDLKAGRAYSAHLPRDIYLGLNGYCEAAEQLSPTERQKETEQIQSQIAWLTERLNDFRLDQPSLTLWTDQELAASLGTDKSLFAREMYKMCSPSIGELLSRLSTQLEYSPIGSHSLIHTKTKDNEVTRFTRHMALRFQRYYGKSLVDNIASLISALFDQHLDTSYLRKVINATPEGGKFSLQNWQDFPGKTPPRI